jgi:hypothetical protein
MQKSARPVAADILLRVSPLFTAFRKQTTNAEKSPL